MPHGMSTVDTPRLLARPASPAALVERVDLLRLHAARRLDPERQAELGQFLTPAPIARFMASMFKGRRRSLRLLDAGAGTGSLTAAWVAEMCARKHPPEDMTVVTYEVDPKLIEYLRETLEACRAQCRETGVRFEAVIRQEDFIGAGVDALRGGLFAEPREEFDAAILNPPYRKIHSDSRTRRLLEALSAETTNLYTAFLSIAVGLLRAEGEMVAIQELL
jgi:adenine-specific DNA-methyltransferase